MAPKNKDSGKGKGKAAAAAKDDDSKKDSGKGKGKGGLKPATSVNVRHILCEKHARKEEALVKIREGTKFDEVAREYSEDKARQGESGPRPAHLLLPLSILNILPHTRAQAAASGGRRAGA